MKMLTSILLFTVLMCESQLTSCDHSKVNNILNSFIKKCFAYKSLKYFQLSKFTVLKDYKALVNTPSETFVNYVNDKLFTVTKVLSCDYVLYLLYNANILVSYFEICIKINEEQNKEAAIKCFDSLKTCNTKVNKVITYFISALDYLTNLTNNDLKTFINDYTATLKMFEIFELFTINLNADNLSLISENVILNEENIEKLDTTVKDNQTIYNNFANKYCDNILDGLPDYELHKLKSSFEYIYGQHFFSKCNNDPALMHTKYMEFLKEIIAKYYSKLGFKYDTDTNKTLYNN
ncbi:uncharacterized protein LOC126894426 isoform X2 [Daktulosphaira vitifoliae]|uniref:uncharacterized protein LOC126894426 isoform X2 n=1 Tax=Daktulosphaira vitifoliae TaxID=58002 RepID=UPI0021AAE421|nr:uncharacterized protein LOC126894426 isoform X2 [Daktulosphaira vitifoliae]